MKIREADMADLSQIEELERRCFSEPWPREAIEAYLGGGQFIMLAAEADGGALAGYAGAQYVLDEGYIGNVCTAPEYRRRGVARALLRELRARAERLGLAFLTLEARSSNAAAIALYEGEGYERVGVRPGYYERPAEDAVIMTLFLREGQA